MIVSRCRYSIPLRIRSLYRRSRARPGDDRAHARRARAAAQGIHRPGAAAGQAAHRPARPDLCAARRSSRRDLRCDGGRLRRARARADDCWPTSVACVDGIKHAKRHLKHWMRPSRRSPNFPLGLLGAKAQVQYQPMGVIGNIVPWNFPVYLAFGPLTGMLAAGNRAMIKMSEFVPHTAALVERLVASAFDETEVAVFQGGPEVGAAFGGLPFDHLFFTGSPKVGKLVMRAAAENLTPVTLELGGKSPVVVGRTADLAQVASRVAWGKTFNSGQVCLAPDYVLLPEERRAEFVEAMPGGGHQNVSRRCGTTRSTRRSSTICNSGGSRSYLDDARQQGRRDHRNQSGAGGLRHSEGAQDAADAAVRSARRLPRHAERDLRAAAAGEDLPDDRRGASPTSTHGRGRSPSITSATTALSRRACSRRRRRAARASTK